MTSEKKEKGLKILLIIIIFVHGATAGFFFSHQLKSKNLTTEKDKYLTFISEVYDKITENYWDKIGDEQLTSLFVLGIEKLTGQPQNLKTNDKVHLEKLLTSIVAQMETEEKKKEFIIQLADIVLTNLKPFGRSRLYTQKEEEALSKNVKNITEVDHYQALGVDKDAPPEEVEKAYSKKEKSPEVERAHKILSNPESREAYDTAGVEPTVNSKLVRPNIFYIHITKMSPITLNELKRLTEAVDNQNGLDSLILDLRDNIGGSIDSLPYFLGPFIGANQYAYQFFHQGETTDFKTKTGWLPSLVRYKKMVILINKETQSSAEVVAATLKKYNVGVVVGTPTKGWGTVEKVFHLETRLNPKEKYSIFLAHSLALRDDGQPIENNGVQPEIDISHPGWEEQLYAYFHYHEMVEAVKEVLRT